MKVIKVIVDKMPNGCSDCEFAVWDSSTYKCVCLGINLPFDMNEIRTHLCPFKKTLSKAIKERVNE